MQYALRPSGGPFSFRARGISPVDADTLNRQNANRPPPALHVQNHPRLPLTFPGQDTKLQGNHFFL